MENQTRAVEIKMGEIHEEMIQDKYPVKDEYRSDIVDKIYCLSLQS
jgi:hypothetical protein